MLEWPWVGTGWEIVLASHGQAHYPGPGLVDRLGRYSLSLAIELSWECVHSQHADV